MFIPAPLRHLRRRPRGSDALVTLRQTFVAFVGALGMYGVVLAFLYPDMAKATKQPTLAFGLLVLGLAGWAGRLAEQPLNAATAATLRASYETRFFLRVAFAESAALFGFVAFFVSNEWWAYPLGVLIATPGFLRAAPTRQNLAHDQEQLRSGSSLSLVRVLRGLDDA